MSMKNLPLLQLLNCFLLVAVTTLLVYNAHTTMTSHDGENEIEETNSRRHKRSARGDQHGQSQGGATFVQGGSTYIRWGRTECPDVAGTELVYAGVVGGQLYTNPGGGANYLCLPMDPLWANFNSVLDNKANIYGGEYELPNSFPVDSGPIPNIDQHNPPCAVCRVNNRSSAFMLPARNQCYPGWTLEYWGYLATSHYGHAGRTDYICLDGKPEGDDSGYRNENGALLYSVEGRCGSLPCPPYAEGRELTCSVCTK